MARNDQDEERQRLDRLGRICDILECTSDSLLGTDEPLPPTARPPAPAPEDDSPAVRRLLRRLRKARPRTVRVVTRMFTALDRHASAATSGVRARSVPGDDDAASGVSSGHDGTQAAGAVPIDDGGDGGP